jgi:hypothetical protein
MVTSSSRRRRLIVPTATVVSALVLVSGCSGGEDSELPATKPSTGANSTSASSTTTKDPSAAAAMAAATVAYLGFFTTYAEAAAVADPDEPRLSQYAGGALLARSRHDLRTLKDHGAVELGNPTATILGGQADLAAAPPSVHVEACVDYHDYRLVYQNNRSPVPNGDLKVKRYKVSVTVQLFADNRWRVAEAESHRDSPC